MGGHPQSLRADLRRREMDRRTRGNRLAAGEASLPVWNDGGIASHYGDRLGRHRELLGADLRERGLDPLPHRHGARVDRDAAGAADAYDAELEGAAAGALHPVADTDAEIAALGAGTSLALGKPGIADGVERHALAGGKVAAVERDRGARAGLQWNDIRHFLRRHQVAAPHLGAVEARILRDPIEQPLHGEGGFRIAGAPHRHGSDLVGLHDQHVELVGREQVGPGTPVEAL